MKISELLMELGDRPQPYTITKTNHEFICIDESSGLELSFIKLDSRMATILFSVDGESHVTGKGNAVSIFSTIGKMLSDNLVNWLTENKMSNVSFSATKFEPSRIKLYDTMVKYINRILGPDWEHTLDNESMIYKHYKWKRK